jgi:phage terminase Nu1 subunit (DNA packaging protein)
MNKNTENTVRPENPFIFGTAQICDFFNVSRETLSSWEKKGAPKEGRGKWDLKKLIEWKFGTGDDRELSLEARKLKADVRYRETKADVEEIKKLEKVGQYVSVEDVTKDLAEVFSRIKQGLLFLGHRIAAEVNAQYPEVALEVKGLVDEEVRKGLKQLAQTGTYSDGNNKRRCNTKTSNK